MVFQNSFLFLAVLVLFPITFSNNTLKNVKSVESNSIQVDYLSPSTTGIIEIYQGLIDISVQINLEGNIKLTVSDEVGNIVKALNMIPFQKKSIGMLPNGTYLFKATVNGNEAAEAFYTVE